MPLRLFNTLTRKKQVFKPLHDRKVGLYTCGPTVYHYAHIGNLRAFVAWDILRRTLRANGYAVTHVMNITDVGHLTSDADEGEDKLEKGARREKKTVWDIARFYTDAFFEDADALNIARPDIVAPATHEIKAQIALIETLFRKGYAYATSRAVYFDVAKFKTYTKLSRQKLGAGAVGSRAEVVVDPEKRHPYDFALWFKLVGRFQKHTMQWSSPWGAGFPGWHIECSAISARYLGQPFDIHTGGVDHIAVHHTNEIAQSEAAAGKPLARFWLHNEHLLIARKKIAKSAGSFITLRDIKKKGFDPLAFRYLLLTSHYRSKLNFAWGSLDATSRARTALCRIFEETAPRGISARDRKILAQYGRAFMDACNDDLNTPRAIAVLWNAMRDKNLSLGGRQEFLISSDAILGLGLAFGKPAPVPRRIAKLLAQRDALRRNKQFIKADVLRKKAETLGYKIDDTPRGTKISRMPPR